VNGFGSRWKAFLVAVIVPNFELLQGPAEEHGLKGKAEENLAHPAVQKAVMDSLNATAKTAKLHGFEYLKAFHLEPKPFTIEANLLTPSFKLRRPDLKISYQKDLDRMYEETNAALEKAEKQKAAAAEKAAADKK